MTLTYIRNGSTLALDQTACTRCLMCLEVCPHAVFEGDRESVRIVRRDRCIECGACATNCAPGAVTVRSGVGCATAVLNGLLRKSKPSCGCSSEAEVACCESAKAKKGCC